MATMILEGDLPETIPVNPVDGTLFPFVMAFNDSVILAETRTELAAELIEGYAEIPDTEAGNEEALFARYRSCVDIANTTQGLIAGQAAETGTFDPAVETEDILTALFTDKSEKIDEIAEWSHKVPLVLVATGYAPYNSTPRPAGNVLWLDPYTETTYLGTLADTGLIELVVQEA